MKKSHFGTIILLVICVISFTVYSPLGDAKQKRRGKALSFTEKKAQSLVKMNRRLAALQGRIACVQSAQSNGELKNCRPHRKGRKRKGKKRR